MPVWTLTLMQLTRMPPTCLPKLSLASRTEKPTLLLIVYFQTFFTGVKIYLPCCGPGRLKMK